MNSVPQSIALMLVDVCWVGSCMIGVRCTCGVLPACRCVRSYGISCLSYVVDARFVFPVCILSVYLLNFDSFASLLFICNQRCIGTADAHAPPLGKTEVSKVGVTCAVYVVTVRCICVILLGVCFAVWCTVARSCPTFWEDPGLQGRGEGVECVLCV